ncbi:MAG: hypothetical protein JSS83_02340 [Cyanobacteria bacterium SZAS LIN-3]|nr:hypothetical protein [Cyanobacteria bacterium SZAS LIN-3]
MLEKKYRANRCIDSPPLAFGGPHREQQKKQVLPYARTARAQFYKPVGQFGTAQNNQPTHLQKISQNDIANEKHKHRPKTRGPRINRLSKSIPGNWLRAYRSKRLSRKIRATCEENSKYSESEQSHQCQFIETTNCQSSTYIEEGNEASAKRGDLERSPSQLPITLHAMKLLKKPIDKTI